jgi:membrane protein DedA with SNARE-associated domain
MPESTVLDRQPPGRRTLTLIVAPLVALVIASWVGDALAPSLVDRHPLVLIMLNARNRNLALVTNQLDAVPYYTVGTLRLLVSDPLFYLLGYFYGDAAVRWMERRSPTYGRFLRTAERSFGTFAYPLVFVAPNNFICLFAGAAGMSPLAFVVLNLSGTLVRLYLIRRVGEAFEGPIDSILEFIREYRLPLLAVTVGLVALTIWNERRQGTGEIESLTHLDEEMAQAGEELEAEHEVDHHADEDGRP